LCVDLKRRLPATTSLDLNRVLNLARITRISFKEISRNLIWKARASAVEIGRQGQEFFSSCLDIFEGSHHYASQLDGVEIHFHLLHLRNDSAVNHMDGALPNGQGYTCLGFRFAVGPTHQLREVTLCKPRPDSPIYTRLVNPGFLGKPVVIGLAD
jgi:hypothetical protein